MSYSPRDPGLDIRQLAAHRTLRHNTTRLVERIAAHVDEFDGYLAFSGGKDSLVALHLARQADPNVPVCFFDSGLEYPETYTYIANLTETWNLNLEVITARYSTLEVLVSNGSWSHARTSHSRASLATNNITEPASTAHHRYGEGEIWGIRAEESAGRRVHLATAYLHSLAGCSCCATSAEQLQTHGGITARKDGTTAFSPVWNWNQQEIWGYIARHNLPANPVYDKLLQLGAPEHAQRVSHAIDAGELHRGRLVWLKRGWPSLYESIVDVLPRAAEHT